MSAFHEAIKRILAEVDKFLNSTLKDENLSKSTQKERTKIVDSLQKLYEEYEVLNPNVEDGSSNSSKGIDESRFTVGSTHSHGSLGSEEDGSVDNIPYTTVKALTEPTKLGYLQKKPTDLLEKLSKQKKYCVIHKNIIYWFKKSSDKKHQGAMFLTGCEFKDLSQGDREFLFELKSNKKSYQFQADTREDLEDWKKAVETGSKFVEPIKEDIMEEGGDSGEEYEPIDDVVEAVRKKQAAENASISSAASAVMKPLPSLPTKSPSLPSTPRQPLPPPQEPSSPQEEYADGFSMTAESSKVEETKKTPVANITSATTPPANVPVSNDFEDDDLIYEFVEEPPLPPSKNKNISDQSLSTAEKVAANITFEEPPPLPSRLAIVPQPPLPPLPQSPISACTPPKPPPVPPSMSTPPTPKMISPNLDVDTSLFSLEEDFENLFFGVFTCVGDSANELSFDRGDVIHVLNRDLDLDNWWIGESFGKVGLVPKEFLIPMYEIMAQT